MIEAPAPTSYKIVLSLMVICVFALWLVSNSARTTWPGVPPVPQKRTAAFSTLSDDQMFYRISGLTLQNLGDTGGRVIPLDQYNYKNLSKWFFLSSELDPKSDFIPMLAAYYFGATRDKEDLEYIVDYLEEVGNTSVGEKWRWLVQAVFISRFKMNDLDRSLELAYKLSSLSSYNSQMPIWTKQMPAFVLAAKGEKEAAKELMKVILGSTKNLHPNEVNYMEAYINDDL
jgi:hypothetical protein